MYSWTINNIISTLPKTLMAITMGSSVQLWTALLEMNESNKAKTHVITASQCMSLISLHVNEWRSFIYYTNSNMCDTCCVFSVCVMRTYEDMNTYSSSLISRAALRVTSQAFLLRKTTGTKKIKDLDKWSK